MKKISGQTAQLARGLPSAIHVRGETDLIRAKHLPMRHPQALENDPPGSGEVRISEPPAHVATHEGLRLHTAFQPIISVVHSRIVGHEALLRGHDERDEPLTPAELFPQLVATLSARQVNETCARLHMKSFTLQKGEGWLFLNVSPDSMAGRREVVLEFGAWLKDAGIPPHQVVVEIIETRAYDEAQLAEAVSGFRDLGCLVAIDDFGAGESNFERVWRFQPDLVKLDRAMITEAAISPLVQRLLPGIVSLVHEAGCLVVMEGIETERQALIAMESDVDFVQGYYFSHPHPRYDGNMDIRSEIENLAHHIRSTQEERSEMDRGFFAGYMAGLEACVSALEDGIGFHDACAMFLAVSGVQRVYELDSEGYQVGSNAESPARALQDPRFSPCADSNGANWFRRPFFQRAMEDPRRIQISRPYLSVRDARTCVTMSIAFERKDEMRVLCVDLDYEHAEPPSHRARYGPRGRRRI